MKVCNLARVRKYDTFFVFVIDKQYLYGGDIVFHTKAEYILIAYT